MVSSGVKPHHPHLWQCIISSRTSWFYGVFHLFVYWQGISENTPPWCDDWWVFEFSDSILPRYYDEIMLKILEGRLSGTSQEKSWGCARLRSRRQEQSFTTSSILLPSILVQNEILSPAVFFCQVFSCKMKLFLSPSIELLLVIWQTLQNSWHATFHWIIHWKAFEVGAVVLHWTLASSLG